MLKKDYAQLVDRAIGKIEAMYSNSLDYTYDEAKKAALSSLGLTEKDYNKIKQDER